MAPKQRFYLQVLLPGVLIPVAVGMLLSLPKVDLGAWVRVLPHVHASINASTSLVLLASLVFIKNRQVQWHRRSITLALWLGGLFLASYVLYHLSSPSTKYGDLNHDGLLSAAESLQSYPWRRVYLVVLLSHIVLAMFVVFFVLLALYFVRIKAFKRHKHFVVYAFPLWLYVSISGVVVYLMIRPYYA